ncbi:TIGR01777 family oxidoreductase [Acinetobacter rongchengensis]|uniref:TIGR01777 family protein n=1 Tax=Acinetobacter rongchengensis TaxID=2419601 RepID=A0A3A8F3I0_9GAMM|nr:TIGR01777 family oxidoreductase [Acinetobacter rongchengensis]RKG35273.1 TIGR01777 family protein [Acinetobacter rongchengensis]
MKTVLVTGATGFIGSHLLEYLFSHGFYVVGYSRQKKASTNTQLRWIQDFSELKNLTIDYVVNLAGESIGEGRWTAKRKQQLIQSRVVTTQKLYHSLEQFQIKPECIVSASAIGFYGIDLDENWDVECDETSAPQNIFMSELCQKWEAEALSHLNQNTKIMRLGVVFGKGGGILPQMLLPIKLNLMGRIGSGRQPMTWVHVDDVIQAILFLLSNHSDQKIYNVVAPDHISQLQFAQTAAQVLKRKPVLFLPSFVMKMLMGEQSQLVLNGQYVQPKALLKENFQFQYVDLTSALKQITN